MLTKSVFGGGLNLSSIGFVVCIARHRADLWIIFFVRTSYPNSVHGTEYKALRSEFRICMLDIILHARMRIARGMHSRIRSQHFPNGIHSLSQFLFHPMHRNPLFIVQYFTNIS